MAKKKPELSPVDAAVERLMAAVRKRKEADAVAAQLAEVERAAREDVLALMGTTRSLTYDAITVTRLVSTVYRIDDWDVVFAFAKRKGNDDIVQRRVSTEAIRARMERGVEVPGVTGAQVESLRVTLKG